MALLLLALFAAVPMFAAVGSEIAIPVAGRIILPGDIAYVTHLTITNHRDTLQPVVIQWLGEAPHEFSYAITLAPKETIFHEGRRDREFFGRDNTPGTLRFIAVKEIPKAGYTPDPDAKIEVNATIAKLRGRFGLDGSSRQEMEGVPSSEYLAREAVFLGLTHELPTYTNVGVANLSTTETMTYVIRFGEKNDPIELTVAPQSSAQIRIPGEFAAGTFVRIHPQWALTNGTPTPWVAYASTVDGYTGDAFSGMRVPAGINFR